MNPITAFLPCRAGSERVPLKNTRSFAGHADGLLGIKLSQLAACEAIDRILVSTNDPVVIAIAERHAVGCPKIAIDRRAEHLCRSSTSTDELIAYAASLVEAEVLLWTHVTSPLVDAAEYTRMIACYRAAIAAGSHDSLMAVTTLRTFLWTETGPINYDRAVEKWPRTQTLPPVYAINSAAFLIDGPRMRTLGDRVGERPILYEMDEILAFDVDWEEQFHIAQSLFEARFGAGPG